MENLTVHQQSPRALFNSPLQLRQKTTMQANNKINDKSNVDMKQEKLR